MELLNIKEYTKEWKSRLKDRLDGQAAELVIVQVGNVEASNRYVRNKIKDCEEVGIHAIKESFPEDITREDFIFGLKNIVDRNPAGIIVQLPLPKRLMTLDIPSFIPRDMDVDGFRVDSPYNPCTPGGIIHYLKDCGFPFEGSNVTVIGRSEIVGKPIARMLTDLDATVTLCHSKTKGLAEHIRKADLVICAVGKERFLNCYPIHVPVVDVGINFTEEGKLVGDCFNTEDRMVTPVPGGVGLLTRCALLENVAKSIGA